MNSQDYLKDISEIKNLMNKSSRFISLSGLSGIMAGIYALIGSAFAYWLVNNHSYGKLLLDGWVFRVALLDLLIVLVASVGTAVFLTTKKAKKNKVKIWDTTTKRLLVSFVAPLIAGGIYIIIILSQGRYGQTGGLMLLFYGLALINASKHTYGDIKYLGYTEIVLGLLSSYFIGYGFWFWVLGFGVVHIIYGTLMYFKYDKK
ncbi:hypothetical protein [Tenacibaculum haliotis]|uniref:hypothetical protein n=1 Tax=Tenacibaculum haliotis TaxID=1888914 RepID=UPI0021B07402|nr:hypothetical protein [Tenacibaculum haliotis]MCT4697637.1 hypothetical protein [Tenacibaculum haliotis]